MSIFFVVFKIILSRGGPDYFQFLLIGLIVWQWFGNTVNHCGNSIVGAKSLIGQVSIPNIIFPTVIIVTDSFKTLLNTIILFIILFLTGFLPNTAYYALPFVIFTQFLMILAVGYSLAAIVPFFLDLRILISLGLRMMWFLSGVFFDPRQLPEAKQRLFFMNPMARIINEYRNILMYKQFPEFIPLIWISIISFVAIIMASIWFNKKNTTYAKLIMQ